MQSIKTFLRLNQKHPIDNWLFFFFLLTFSFSVRKILFYFPIEGTFNEYTALNVHLSEIFLILAISLWLFTILLYYLTILSNYYNQGGLKYQIKAYIKQNKAIDKLWTGRVIHSLPRAIFTSIKIMARFFFVRMKRSAFWSLPLILVLWSFISTWWSQNQTIAIFRSFKFFELYLLYLYLVFRIIPWFSGLFSNNRQNVESLKDKLFHPVNSDNVPPRNTKNCSTPKHKELFHVEQFFVTGQAWNNSLLRGRRGTILKFIARGFFSIITFVALIQSITAIWQFFVRHSLGLRFLRESIISPDIPGVAKIILDGDKFIRAYGLMPHPNILGGFLVFSIIITWLYIKLFHPVNSNNVPRGTLLEHGAGVEQYWNTGQAWNNSAGNLWARLKRKVKIKRPHILLKIWLYTKKYLVKAILLTYILALLLTFSKSAILALAVASLYIFWKTRQYFSLSKSKIVPRGTILRYGTKAGQFRIIILSSLVVLLFVFIFIKPDLNSIFIQSLNERFFYLNVSRGTILAHPILGVGAGQFIFAIPHFTENVVMAWQYQSVHNVYLLILAEIGFIGLGLFLGWIVLLLKARKKVLFSETQTHSAPAPLSLNVPRGTFKLFAGWNNSLVRNKRGTIDKHNSEVKTESPEKASSVLCNNNIELSREIVLTYFKGILLSFLFIMFFDHYFWDIWQGQVMFWLVAGIIAGIIKFDNSA